MGKGSRNMGSRETRGTGGLKEQGKQGDQRQQQWNQVALVGESRKSIGTCEQGEWGAGGKRRRGTVNQGSRESSGRKECSAKNKSEG